MVFTRVHWSPVDSSPLQSTPVMTDISRLGCGESPLESSGVHMEYGGDRQELLSMVTENRDVDINIMSNGRVILFPMPHGNQNMHFLMMAKYWLTTKNTTDFNFYFVSIQTHVSLSTVQHGQRIIRLLRDHLQSHWLLGWYKTCAGNGKRPESHYPPIF